MGDISNIATVYIVLITICWIVVFYAWLRQRDILKKNKHKYDLRLIKFIIEPVSDDNWRLVFYFGDKVLHSEVISEADIMTDKRFFYKAFVKWCEEESK